MMRMFKKDEGFTLVELMVVVLIIGILVAIAIPIFNNASKKARLRTCQSNQRTIEGAVQQYLAADPAYVWTASLVDAGNVLVVGQAYLKKEPKCPAPGGGTYQTDTSGTVTGDQSGAGWITDGGTPHEHF